VFDAVVAVTFLSAADAELLLLTEALSDELPLD
jgi:hypothetical protein